MKDGLEDAPTQRKALDAILDAWGSGEQIRTIQDLADKLKVAKSRAYSAINNLITKGYLEWDRAASGRAKTGRIRPTAQALSLRPTDTDEIIQVDRTMDDDVRRVPLLWRGVAASPPIIANESFADENIRDYLPLPSKYIRDERVFMVEVEGDSMTGDGILDGDFVVVVADPTPSDGEIVVALIGGDATVKRLRHEGSKIRLEPSNPDFAPIIVDGADELAIRGRVTSVVRWHVQHGHHGNHGRMH
jgi:SOS regulatory protein LexA